MQVLLVVALSSFVSETARAENQGPAVSEADGGTPGARADVGPAALDGGTQVATAPDGGAPAAVSSHPPPKRAPPDYEGRAPETHATEDALLLVPRLVLLPIYVVAEYAVAVPVGALATTAEASSRPPGVRQARKARAVPREQPPMAERSWALAGGADTTLDTAPHGANVG